MGSHHHLFRLHAVEDELHPSFPFPTSSFLLDLDDTHPFSSCPLDAAFHHHLFLPTPTPVTTALHSLSLAAPRRKYTYEAESAGTKIKWTTHDKPDGDRTFKWEAQIDTPNHDGFDRKWKWESKASATGATKLKWAKEVKGKGFLHPWSHAYYVEEVFGDDDHHKPDKPAENKIKDTSANKEKKNKCNVHIVEIDDNTAGCVAINKAFASSYGKGKRKQLSPQDAALLIQMNYRAHLAHRSQVLRCLRDVAVAKAKLKEIRSLFYNISYRRRISHDSEERQRFAEKIIVLLLTVDALEVGPDYMVRNAKRSMLEELEGMLEIVDPQPPGKPRTLSRRKFDLPEGRAISNDMRTGVNNVVKIVEEGK
uniref:BAG domain-containing protein n=1 Tax=Oryza punctata TaxID=4537 RepID=A0A0E0JUF9_ORYPU